MALKRRKHIIGGIYYIVRGTNSPKPVFSRPEDYALLDQLIPAVSRRNGARVLGYCWLPDTLHLVLQVDENPVGDFMRDLTSQYARSVNGHAGRRGQFFRCPYEVTLIDRSSELVMLIHHLHHLPVLATLAQCPDGYAHSSHRAYLGKACVSWLYTRPLLTVLDGSKDPYARYQHMIETPTQEIIRLNRNQSLVSEWRSGEQLGASLTCRRGDRVQTLEEISTYVARFHGIRREQLISRSRRRELVTARAQMAWYVTERRVASLREVARYLCHSASTLTRAIAQHQRRRPEWFTLASFASLTPIAPPSIGANWASERPAAKRIPDSGRTVA